MESEFEDPEKDGDAPSFPFEIPKTVEEDFHHAVFLALTELRRELQQARLCPIFRIPHVYIF